MIRHAVDDASCRLWCKTYRKMAFAMLASKPGPRLAEARADITQTTIAAAALRALGATNFGKFAHACILAYQLSAGFSGSASSV